MNKQMKRQLVVDAFEALSRADYAEKDTDLEKYIRQAEEAGIEVIIENLDTGNYVMDSLIQSYRLCIREAIPSIRKYTDSSDKVIKIWAALALSKMNEIEGRELLRSLIKSGDFPKHWLSWLEEENLSLSLEVDRGN